MTAYFEATYDYSHINEFAQHLPKLCFFCFFYPSETPLFFTMSPVPIHPHDTIHDSLLFPFLLIQITPPGSKEIQHKIPTQFSLQQIIFTDRQLHLPKLLF
jgi:hypothetical protein